MEKEEKEHGMGEGLIEGEGLGKGEAAREGGGENGSCCQKRTERTQEQHRKLIHRLNRIEGQIRGIKRMVEKDAYCTDILMQSAAVTAAINGFNRDLLASHIHSCVARDIRDGKDEVIDELTLIIQKLMK